MQCNKSFAHKTGLSRHKHEHITNNTSNEQSHNTNDHSYNNTHSHNNTNTNDSYNTHNTTYNIQNLNIQLLPFGKEDIQHIKDDRTLLLESLKTVLTSGIPNLIEKIHFNTDVPQNQNVKLKRIKHPATMMVYTQTGQEDPKWVEKDLTSALLSLIDKGADILIKFKNEELVPDPDNYDEVDMDNIRNERFAKIRQRNREVTSRLKNSVLCTAKNARNADTQVAVNST
jgi:hypothetical protein